MPYRFRKKGKPLDEAVRAIAGSQIDLALASLDGSEDAPTAALDVHSRCEKTIGLIALLPGHQQGVAAEIDCFEEIARHVSAAAAVASAQRGLRSLAPYLERRVPNLDIEALDAALTGDGAHLAAQNALAATLLREARERVAEWQVGAADWRDLAGAMVAARDAFSDQPLEDLPELRASQMRGHYRRAVQLWQQSRLLRSVAPEGSRSVRKPLKPICNSAERLLEVKYLKELVQPLAYGFGEASPYEFILVLSRREEILRCAHLHRAMSRLRGSPGGKPETMRGPAAEHDAVLIRQS